MAEASDNLKRLGELPRSHAARIRYLAAADRSVFGTIQFGVLFVMAWWSGPSHQGWFKLKQVLTALDPNGRLEVIMVDTDGCPDLYECPEFAGQLHGWGEVAWVRCGQVVRTSGTGYRPECFEPFTRELLASTPDAEQAAAMTSRGD